MVNRRSRQIAAAVVLAILMTVVACQRTEFQPMSASGFLFRLENGEGAEAFAIDDDSDVTIGDGSPGETQAGEGLYVEGLLEVDGVTYLDGAVDFDGDLDLDGQKLDLDADADTSLTADTDDEVDVEIGGADVVLFKDLTATALTDTKEYMLEITDTTGIGQSGTNAQAALNIDLGIGDSTAGTNSMYGILIDSISADGQNTETALAIGSGWDRGIDLDGNDLYLDDDQDTYIHESGDDVVDFVAGAATGDFRIHTGNLRVGDGSADGTLNGDDAYVEGFLEVDGEIEADGNIDADGGINAAVGTENVGIPSVVSTAITYTAAAGGSGTVATIGDGEIWFVHDILVHVTEEFDEDTGDGEVLIIGDGEDDNGFLDLDSTDLTATYNEGVTGHAAGWLGKIEGNVGVYFDPDGTDGFHNNTFVYAPSGDDETIDWALTSDGNDLSQGAATIYVIYTRIQ